ncbi:hypothetical protein H8356DRAFT_1362856 [Neocallimastix lanati (nom. inval.)]|jgi:hypothetical protein|uniref:C2H2-type domain-containing protein n=1 Tax=Neocallimastix californiae TaxID=1754190 RepID=A0A1Y2EQV7_9FUNG|nr:hypothetical protein H8356DRAFT_1362856 [Neocallimastix sp. JGI-2020a]ORY73960.1 hypothetical protein LY90DRAFT_699428 [Neocallimastix californiae]|eukprot:ORY73960.1 hypothetical protein LY90DRAFT_699428 [Neocallimastix californiae]
MSYNTLLTSEDLDLQLQNTEAQKLLTSQVPGIMDIPDMIPALLNSNLEFGGNINMLPSPETDSLVSSPSISNPDDELDLFGLQPSVQEQEQLLSGIPVGAPSVAGIDSTSYENAILSFIATNQLQSNLPVCEPMVNVNNQNLLLNYPSLLPVKNQSPVMDTFDINAVAGLNDIPLNALNLLNQNSNIEVPSLVPSTVESNVGSEIIDPLLIGATNPYLMNELLEANAMVPSNKVEKMVLNENLSATTVPFEQVNTPPHSPVNVDELKSENKLDYLQGQSQVEIPELDFNLINANAVNGNSSVITVPSSQPVVLNNDITPVVPTQKALPVVQSEVTVPMFTPEVDVKTMQPIISSKNVQTKTNYTYVPITKKRSSSDLKGAKLERRPSNKSNQKKSVPMIKDKNGKAIQKQVKHTFVIETPGINYGKKTSGRKRKCKKDNEEETFASIPQVPQVPCRQSVSIIPPQKLSKIHARTTEDLDSLPFQCEFCPSAFSRKHDLKRHLKVHTGNTAAYKCKHCGKSYARAETLAKHEAAKECQK